MKKPLRYRILHRLRNLIGARKQDDFDWYLYDWHYGREMEEMEAQFALRLAAGDYTFEDGTLVRRNESKKPLPPDWRLLYETILQLAPANACEFGCGGGDHLENLALLAPGLDLVGMDRSKGQLGLLAKRHPDMPAQVLHHSIADPLPEAAVGVDLAYVRAVIMHIHTGRQHRDALANLFTSSTRHVVMQENWTRHAFLDEIRELHAEGRIPWKEVHAHYRALPETGRPILMVLGAEPLPQYPVLESYATLLESEDA